MMVSEESRNRSVQWPISVGTLFCSKGLGSGAGGRSAPHKYLYTCPVTLNAWSHPLWPLFRRECRGATRRSARVSLTQLDITAPEVIAPGQSWHVKRRPHSVRTRALAAGYVFLALNFNCFSCIYSFYAHCALLTFFANGEYKLDWTRLIMPTVEPHKRAGVPRLSQNSARERLPGARPRCSGIRDSFLPQCLRRSRHGR